MSRTLSRFLAALCVACGIVACTPASAGAPDPATATTVPYAPAVTTWRQSGSLQGWSVETALGSTAARIEAATVMHKAVEKRDIEARLAEIAEQKAAAQRRLERLTPTTTAPAPRNAPSVHRATDPGSVEGIIRAAAAEFGIDPERMLRIGRCESGLRPDAISPSGSFQGTFQHSVRYWPARAARLGYGPGDILDATANARVSALMMSEGGWSHWSCK